MLSGSTPDGLISGGWATQAYVPLSACLAIVVSVLVIAGKPAATVRIIA